MGVPLSAASCSLLAERAAELAREAFPRVTGSTSRALVPVYGSGWFGVQWDAPYVWYQESGTRPFTMRSLAGKTVPMWVDDSDGSLRRKNPKIKVRYRKDNGEAQVLIFRRAANFGETKMSWRRIGGSMHYVQVPRSWPGAPGRINRRDRDVTRDSPNLGRIARGNVGVRWRHPGLLNGQYMADGVIMAAQEARIEIGSVVYANSGKLGDVIMAPMGRAL